MPMTKNDYRIHGKDLFVMGKPEPEAVVNASWQQRATITGYARAKQWDTYGRKINNKPRAFFQAEFVVGDETPDVFWERKTAEATASVLAREVTFKDGDHGATEAIAQTSGDCPLCEAGVPTRGGVVADLIDPATGIPTGQKAHLSGKLVQKIEEAFNVTLPNGSKGRAAFIPRDQAKAFVEGGFPADTMPVVGSPTGRLSKSEPVMQTMQKDGTVKRTVNGVEVDKPNTVRNYAVQAAGAQAMQEVLLESLTDTFPGSVEVGSGVFADCVTIHTDDVAGAAKQIEEAFNRTIADMQIPASLLAGTNALATHADQMITMGVDRAKGRDSTSIVVVKGRKNGLNTLVGSYSFKPRDLPKAVDEAQRKNSLHALTSHLKALELRSHECNDRAKKLKLEGKIARTLVALSHLQG